MLTFKDVPDWYKTRISKMYRKNTKLVFKCCNVLKTNHLLSVCNECARAVPYTFEAPVSYELDRLYRISDRAYDKFCLRALVSKGLQVYTSVEFPTPKITSQHITRIPQFYEPSTAIVYDCFSSEKELSENSTPYYINKARKVCAQYGLAYCQVLVTRKEFTILYRSPIEGFDSIAHKLLIEFNKQK